MPPVHAHLYRRLALHWKGEFCSSIKDSKLLSSLLHADPGLHQSSSVAAAKWVRRGALLIAKREEEMMR
ncbi:hypothetical protein E2C01_082218 [Portunus trituberculatus]|uniref:Uncharacterized protein n=1 Tax=Portunus trituberculatus TaxID=210409 RepID=A0A5B7J100_PORTR|nr:hypothetical protein [Portunus trituberculatus]